jgi:hypothetical protein
VVFRGPVSIFVFEAYDDAVETAFPSTTVQTCIVHPIRNSLDCANWKDRKPVAAALSPVYTVATAEAAQETLAQFTGSPASDDHPALTKAMAERHSVLRLSSECAQGDLHHQRDGGGTSQVKGPPRTCYGWPCVTSQRAKCARHQNRKVR